MRFKKIWLLVVLVLITCQNAYAAPDIATLDDLITKGPWTDVRAFGAKGDGKTDDTLSIQRAIDHVASTTQGIVFFPPGAYKITSRLKLDRNVDLVGVGVGFGSQIIPFGSDGISILGSDWPGGYGFRNHIKGLTIMMAQADKGRAIVIDHGYTIKIENVMVFNAGSGGGISIADAGHITLTDVTVYGSGKGAGTGITIKDSNVNLYNPDIEACLDGLLVSGDQGVHVFGGHFERNASYSIRYERGHYNTVIGAKISAPNAQGSTIGFFEGSSSNTVMGSRLEAYKTGFVVYQDSNVDRQNVVMGSYLNGRVSAGIRRQ
jgi:hypothetical protein